MSKNIAVLACLFLTACMVGPDYKEPQINTPKHWAKKDKSVKEKEFKQDKWWDVFDDPNLTQLIYHGYHNNLTLHMAGMRILQARAQLAKSVGGLYPQLQTMNGNYLNYRIGGSYLQDVLPSGFDAALLGFSANWETDFWGKFRRSVRSRDASFLSSVAAYDQALVSLISDIAHTYIGFRGSESLIRITQQNITLQETSLALTMSRYQAGAASLRDVEEAKTQLAETKARLPELISQQQIQKDALAVLLGMVPNDIEALLHQHHGIPKAPEAVEVGIPREMLIRRPDVRQARFDAIMHSETIGATKAELFPAFSLSGSFYFAGNTISGATLSEMFNWSNRNTTIGPGLNWPILNYGQITNMVRTQDALFQEKLLHYQNIILIAQQEVQDNITRYTETKKAVKHYEDAVRAAMKATQLTLIQYKEGETGYTSVLYAQQQQFYTQTALVNARAELPKSLVNLYRALGGGWQIRENHDYIPETIKRDMAKRTNWGKLLLQQNHEVPETKYAQFKTLYFPTW
ncbi:MAG: efflux transporter outer membrane subunit [Legionella sp.]|jgi:NodT family efflux transporter outer membrane factor (OMF) lipoprotein|nr:efflux transporter outer membrane subunit [Legionella sp.]